MNGNTEFKNDPSCGLGADFIPKWGLAMMIGAGGYGLGAVNVFACMDEGME